MLLYPTVSIYMFIIHRCGQMLKESKLNKINWTFCRKILQKTKIGESCPAWNIENC